uniref:RRP15-like protein n=1 Tax=Anabas testudineus TaxID=64144 RepID=A0A3Q1H0T9_ANATE
ACGLSYKPRQPERCEDAVPLCKNYNDQSDSERGSNDERSDDGESEGEENVRDGVGEERDDSNINTGWAEAMAKILGKKIPESKSNILVRNTEMDKMKKREQHIQLERKKQVDKRHAWEMMCREKPDIVKDREPERALQRIATRGVVQLFNAVRKHQKTMEHKVQEVGASERKKAKILSSVSKKDFIDVLRRTEGGAEKPVWSVLRDDFMMGATMKDWDKDSDREETYPHKRGDSDSN